MLKRLRAWVFRLSAYRISVIVGLAFSALLFLVHGRLDSVPVVGRIERIFHDLKFTERGPRKPYGDVVVAAADEKSLKVLGRWIFPRSTMAVLVDKLTDLGAKAIVFDIAYIDAASEGQFAAATRLRMQFEQMSLAGQEAAGVVDKLDLAKASVDGAAEAAKSLPQTDSAAQDVRARLTPVSDALNEAASLVKRYKTLHADFAQALSKEGAGQSGDIALGAAVHRGGRVVLGSLLDEKADEPTDSKETKAALDKLRHVQLRFPTIDPIDLSNSPTLDRESAPVYGVKFPNFAKAEVPLDPLLLPTGNLPATQVAFFNTAPDEDGVIRREPLVLSVGERSKPDQLVLLPDIDLGGVLKFYDADPREVRLWGGATKDDFEYVAFLPGSAVKAPGEIKISDFRRIPVNAQGEMLLNYYGPQRTFKNISLGDIWNNAVQKPEIEGKVVLVGATASGTFDQRVTPFDKYQPGVEIHATAIENILHSEYLTRPWWATPVELAILLAIALIVGRLLTRVSVRMGMLLTILCALAYHSVDILLFRSGYAIFSAYPIAEVATIFVAQTIFRYGTEEAEKRKIRKAFQLYLQPTVIEEMLSKHELPKLGGEKKTLTVLFSDIRGFTTISEKLSPEQLAKLINEYLTPMTNLVFEHGGTLDKYIGDALMAIFGAPIDQSDHAMRCCKTAVHMMRELARLQERWRMEGMNYPPIDIGIGINSGPMVVGNMGADQRFDYTVLGDNVNLASRLEGTNKEYGSHIIISENTYRLCEGKVAVRELGAVRVKGKREPVRIYELLDDAPATGEMAEVIQTFDAGIAFFRAQKWEEARQKFRAVLGVWSEDGPAKAYIEFCNEYEAHPPGADWDGVYTMTHK